MTSQIRREPTQCKRDSRATRTKSAQRADKLSYLLSLLFSVTTSTRPASPRTTS